MSRIPFAALALVLVTAAFASMPVRAAGFPINYSDPSSDVVQLNATTGLCVVDAGGACIMSPDPHDVNIQWLRGSENATRLNLTIVVQGDIRNLGNTSYIVNVYADATNQTHWSVNYTNGVLLLYTNLTGASRTDISGNATLWGPNPTSLNSLTMVVTKSLLGATYNATIANLDATAIMRGDPGTGQKYSYQDFGWEIPGHPASSPTMLKGHVYVRGTTTPIAGASVSIGSQSVATDATGYYEISLSPGTYNVTVAADGYAGTTSVVTLTLGQTVTHDVELDRSLAGTLAADALWIALAVIALIVVIVLVARRKKKKGVRVA